MTGEARGREHFYDRAVRKTVVHRSLPGRRRP
jgi:hypothetical protein